MISPIEAQPLNDRIISRTLFRYLIRDMFFSFSVSFLFFFGVFFVNQLLLMAQEILAKHVPFLQVMMLVFFALPQIIAMSSPFASLMGTLMTIGRMSSDNEVLIILASGLSYKMVFVPAAVVGILISVASFFTNDVLLPAGTIQFAKLYRKILVSTPALELEANSVKRFKDTTIVTGPVEGMTIGNILILDRTNDGERRIIMAQDAELKDSGREGLSLDLSNAFIQSSKEIVRNDYDYAFMDSLRYWVPQSDLIQAISSISPNQMSTTDLRKAIAVKGQELDVRLDKQYGKCLTSALDLEDSLRKGDSGWNRRENSLETFGKEHQIIGVMKRDRSYALYRFEYNQKYAVPFGAFSFVFLAVSLGLYAKKSGQTVGFIFGMIISCVFWALLIGGKTAGIRLGYSPFLTMWLPNIIAISAGSVLFAIKIRR